MPRLSACLSLSRPHTSADRTIGESDGGANLDVPTTSYLSPHLSSSSGVGASSSSSTTSQLRSSPLPPLAFSRRGNPERLLVLSPLPSTAAAASPRLAAPPSSLRVLGGPRRQRIRVRGACSAQAAAERRPPASLSEGARTRHDLLVSPWKSTRAFRSPKSKLGRAHQSGSYWNPFPNRSEVQNRWGCSLARSPDCYSYRSRF